MRDGLLIPLSAEAYAAIKWHWRPRPMREALERLRVDLAGLVTASCGSEVTDMSKAKPVDIDVTPVPETSTALTVEAPKAMADFKAPGRSLLQDPRLEPYFQITDDGQGRLGAWARGPGGTMIAVDFERACVTAAQLGPGVDDTARAAAAAALVRDHAL